MFQLREQKIYNHLGDEISRKIFEKRLSYNKSGDVQYLRDIIAELPEGKQFVEKLSVPQKKFLFGAGAWGKELAHVFQGEWYAFLDNNSNLYGKKLVNLEVHQPTSDLLRDSYVYISTRLYYDEIESQLMDLGVKRENIINVGLTLDTMAKRQYFDLMELPHDEEECFVDVGGLDGETSLRFIDWSKRYGHIYCFEVDKNNLIKCKANLKNVENAHIIDKAAWSHKGFIGFEACGNGSSFIDENAVTMVPVTTIDDEMEGKRVTFIKMDIEGAENEALEGAKKVISLQKPKLAIAIYHKTEDLLTIPEKLLDYNPGYNLYLRHYSLTGSETVLYAF